MKKYLINLSAGIGDGVMLMPILREIKSRSNVTVDGYFTQRSTYDLYQSMDLLDNLYFKKDHCLLDCRMLGYDYYLSDFLLDFRFAANSFLGWLFWGSKVKVLYAPHKKFKSRFAFFPHFEWIKMRPDIHMALQPFLLLDKSIPSRYPQCNLGMSSENILPDSRISGAYVVIQLVAGDQVSCGKNWPITHWSKLLLDLSKCLPHLSWIIIGGPAEVGVENELPRGQKNIISLIGKTKINEAIELVRQSNFYLGLDSGMMHIAAALGVPTISLWGPSASRYYGYPDGFNGASHLQISLNKTCSPCQSPINPNISRVRKLSDCPDLSCMRDLHPDYVIDKVLSFVINKGLQ